MSLYERSIVCTVIAMMLWLCAAGHSLYRTLLYLIDGQVCGGEIRVWLGSEKREGPLRRFRNSN